ncbi:hypothetical protein IFR05_006072 [Cadophora sp. M221]|nr:hypothetical protein IFR05_006072 [Cadophora sp. M221]
MLDIPPLAEEECYKFDELREARLIEVLRTAYYMWHIGQPLLKYEVIGSMYCNSKRIDKEWCEPNRVFDEIVNNPTKYGRPDKKSELDRHRERRYKEMEYWMPQIGPPMALDRPSSAFQPFEISALEVATGLTEGKKLVEQKVDEAQADYLTSWALPFYRNDDTETLLGKPGYQVWEKYSQPKPRVKFQEFDLETVRYPLEEREMTPKDAANEMMDIAESRGWPVEMSQMTGRIVYTPREIDNLKSMAKKRNQARPVPSSSEDEYSKDTSLEGPRSFSPVSQKAELLRLCKATDKDWYIGATESRKTYWELAEDINDWAKKSGGNPTFGYIDIVNQMREHPGYYDRVHKALLVEGTASDTPLTLGKVRYEGTDGELFLVSKGTPWKTYEVKALELIFQKHRGKDTARHPLSTMAVSIMQGLQESRGWPGQRAFTPLNVERASIKYNIDCKDLS